MDNRFHVRRRERAVLLTLSLTKLTLSFLRLDSILLSSNGVAKLCDFGVSHIFDDTIDKAMRRQGSGCLTRQDTDMALNLKPMAHDGLMTKTEGTWAFWSPEMCEGGRAFSGYAADLWAAGVCLYIFVTGKLPFYSEVPVDLMNLIKVGKVPYDENMSDQLVDLLHMALHRDPEQRAGVGDCLQHPFLNRAREYRIQQLSDEFARSKATNTVVEESDIRHVRFCDSVWFLADASLNVVSHVLNSPNDLFFTDGTGVSYCYFITSGTPSISIKAVARGLQSSEESVVLWWSRESQFLLRS